MHAINTFFSKINLNIKICCRQQFFFHDPNIIESNINFYGSWILYFQLFPIPISNCNSSYRQ